MTLIHPPTERRFGQCAALMLSLLLMLAAFRDACACSCQSTDQASTFNNADEVVGSEVIGTERYEKHI